MPKKTSEFKRGFAAGAENAASEYNRGLAERAGISDAEFKRGVEAGIEQAAVLLEGFGPDDYSSLAKMVRTVAAGGTPCEDCGYPLPSHDETCVSRHHQEQSQETPA